MTAGIVCEADSPTRAINRESGCVGWERGEGEEISKKMESPSRQQYPRCVCLVGGNCVFASRSCAEELGWALVWVDVDRKLDVECLRQPREGVDGGVVFAGLQARDLWLGHSQLLS